MNIEKWCPIRMSAFNRATRYLNGSAVYAVTVLSVCLSVTFVQILCHSGWAQPHYQTFSRPRRIIILVSSYRTLGQNPGSTSVGDELKKTSCEKNLDFSTNMQRAISRKRYKIRTSLPKKTNSKSYNYDLSMSMTLMTSSEFSWTV